jgi:hypothetical protein
VIRDAGGVELGTILASGWASGLNLYGTALLIGLAGRFEWADTPEALQRPEVLATLFALFLVEFVVDKVPWLDSTWDAIHLAIRPLGGALLTGMMAADAGSNEVLVAMVGGTFALTAHGAKSSTRALANTSPEPVSNTALSLGEDGMVAAMVALALAYPVVAGVLAVLLAAACVVVTWVVFRMVRRTRARWRDRRRRRLATP